MKTFALPALGALLCVTGASSHAQSAQDRRFYVGIDLGHAELNRNLPASGFTQQKNRDATGWKLRFGYRFSPRFSLETAFTDFGDYDGTALVFLTDSGTPYAAARAPGDYTTSAKGMELSAVSNWPLGETFYVSASAGILRRETTSVFQSFTAAQPAFRGQDGDLALQFGAGLGYIVNETLDVVASWTTSQHLEGDTEFFENGSDPALVSLGLRVRF